MSGRSEEGRALELVVDVALRCASPSSHELMNDCQHLNNPGIPAKKHCLDRGFLSQPVNMVALSTEIMRKGAIK